MPWYLYLAFKQLFPTGRWFPFFTVMSALGVAVGVALLVVTTSIMGGFGHEIRRMIIDTQGEVQIASAQPIPAPEELVALIEKTPGVQAVSPYARGFTQLTFNDKPVYPTFLGVDLQRIGSVVPFNRYVVRGTFDALDDDSVLVSVMLARSLDLQIGDAVEVLSPIGLQKMMQGDSGDIFLPRVLRVAGLYEIGHPQLDGNTVIVSLRLMQELYGLGDSVHGISIRLKPGADEFAVAAALNRELPRGQALTWFESNVDFQNIIRFEKNMVFFLLTFIVIVAALSIMSSLTIAVVRKTREIGLLGALGGRRRDVALCFCAQGFFLGLVGTGAGLLIAWGVIAWRVEIVTILARMTVSEEVFQQFYGFINLPSYTSSTDLVVIIVGSVASATIAGLLPSLRAAKLKPVEALRSE